MSSYAIEAVAAQAGAALESLERAIRACPDDVWGERPGQHVFGYMAFHTLFWHDFYLSPPQAEFVPPPPYGFEEMDPAGVLPPRLYTKDEMLAYLEHGHAKLRAAFAALTDKRAALPCGFPGKELSVLELQIYNLRHLQHHTAQLHLLMRQAGHEPPRWVSRAP